MQQPANTPPRAPYTPPKLTRLGAAGAQGSVDNAMGDGMSNRGS